jgi:hypothetical protein
MKRTSRKRAQAAPTKQDLNEDLRVAALRLVEAFEARFGLHGVNWIYVEHAWVGATYSDGSGGGMLQFPPDRRLGER